MISAILGFIAFDGLGLPALGFGPRGYELEDLNGNFTLPELFCRALCSSRMDCAAFEAETTPAASCSSHGDVDLLMEAVVPLTSTLW